MTTPAQNPPPRPGRPTNKGRLVALVGAGAAAALFAFVPANEGTVFKTYRDAVGVITSCTGHTGPELRMGQVFTPEQCNETLEADLLKHAAGVMACTKVKLSEGEAIAYVDFAFNLGVGAYCQSTMVKLLNAGDRRGACAELKKWVNAGGKPLRGLVIRRGEDRTYCERDLP